MKKLCKSCKEEKFMYEFWKDKNNSDGKRGKCISCLKRKNKENYIENKEERKTKRKDYYLQNIEYIKEKTKKWRKENLERSKLYFRNRYKNLTLEQYEDALRRKREYEKTEKGKLAAKKYRVGEKWVARYTFRNAIRDGKLEKKDTCAICLSKERVEGHHPDYSKPLEVVWLCRKCHSALHQSIKSRKDKANESTRDTQEVTKEG